MKQTLLLLLFFCSSYASETISFQIGSDYFIEKNINFKQYKIKNFGPSIALNIPLNLSSFKTNVKAKFAYHNLKKSNLYDNEYFYASMLNEFLLGKEFSVANKICFLPQFGLGLKNEVIAESKSSGLINYVSLYYLFFDISMELEYQFEKISLGFLLNFEKGFSFDLNRNNKLNFGLLFKL